MSTMKVSDVTRTATLLKKIAARADTNKDGALRTAEVRSVGPEIITEATRNQYYPRAALEGAQKFAMNKGSVTVPAIKDAIDEIASRVKAADKDGDGFISESEWKSIRTVSARSFVQFGQDFSHAKLSDFEIPPQREQPLPRFSWSGTPKQVCSSLLLAYSARGNDNFWPTWSGSDLKGPSRYVVTQNEAREMVKALTPLYTSRQKSVITELARRTHASEFGCVSVSDGARKVFDAYAKSLGVTGLQFKSPAAPKMPAP